jgi:hypothetical protein
MRNLFTTTQIVLCALGAAGIFVTACTIGANEITGADWLAIIAFSALIALSSMFGRGK